MRYRPRKKKRIEETLGVGAANSLTLLSLFLVTQVSISLFDTIILNV
jgi:hypothetical protein